MNRHFAISMSAGFVSAVALLCSGCAVNPLDHGNLSKDEYRTVFSQVIRKSFAETKTDNLCLPPLFGTGPLAPDSIEINVDNDLKTPQSPAGRYSQLKALESVGLLSGVESERLSNGKMHKFVTYTRTDKGNATFSDGAFCYARADLDSIIKWKGPLTLGEYRVAWVYYTSKTTHIAEWASSPAVLSAFPTAVAVVKPDVPKVRQVAIDLSSEGWDIAEYSKLLQMQ